MDNTQAVLTSYGDRIIWKTIRNVGCGASRKAAVGISHGTEWIAFCDSDDVWLPTHIATFESLLSRWPEADILVTNHTTFGAREPEDYDHFANRPPEWWEHISAEQEGARGRIRDNAYGVFLDFNPVFPSTVAVRRSAYEAVGGIDPVWSRVQAEDSDLTRRLVANGVVVCYDMRRTVRLRRDGTNMSTNQVGNMLGRARIVSRQLSKSIVPEEYRSVAQKFIVHSRQEALRMAFNDGDVPRARDAVTQLRDFPVSISTEIRKALLHAPTIIQEFARR